MTLAMTAALAAATGLAVGALGALQSVRLAAHEALKAGATSVSQSRRQRRGRSLLVISEMALSTVLLVGATLLVRSIVHLQTLDPGFDPAHLYAFQVDMPNSRYATPAARTAFLSDIAERVRHVPGVTAATIAGGAPPSRSFLIGALQIEGDPPPPDGATSFVDYNGVEPDYFKIMGIRIVEGSTITDTTKAASQALVNEGFAKKYWPGKFGARTPRSRGLQKRRLAHDRRRRRGCVDRRPHGRRESADAVHSGNGPLSAGTHRAGGAGL